LALFSVGFLVADRVACGLVRDAEKPLEAFSAAQDV